MLAGEWKLSASANSHLSCAASSSPTVVFPDPAGPIRRMIKFRVHNSGRWLPHSKLKFAGFLARPALDHDFRFGEKFHGVAALAVEDAKETFFPAAEGEIGHRRGYADVDADISRRGFVAELAGGGTAGGEE